KMLVEVKCEICESKDLTYRPGKYEGFYCKNCNDMCEVAIVNPVSEKILKPVGIKDDGGLELYEDDFILFLYGEGNAISAVRGQLKYEGCIWIIVNEHLPDGYVELNDYTESDGDTVWAKVDKVK
ncbi:hypothetical protein, partial [Clostridium thermobutyricum]|uniref:hypothetical protein n=1 Tax=Clostridium thermobutyricum TaxID=29372 RepID=UPI003F52417D